MKKVIRRNCFETNSSSMHSIVVTKNDERLTEKEIKDALWDRTTLRIWNEENLCFGRYPFKVLSNLEDKVMYAIANYCGYNSSRDSCNKFMATIEQIIRNTYPKFERIELPKEWKDIFHDAEGNEVDAYKNYRYGEKDDDIGFQYYYYDKDENMHEAIWDREEEVNFYGQVDHQSADMLDSFLNKHGISLEEFLLNKKYVIVIDGDEYCEFDKLIDAKIVNLDNLVEIYPPLENGGQVAFNE